MAGLATIVAPIIAVALALLGWRLRPKREIHVKQHEFSLINPLQNSSDYELVVRHRDQDFSQPVFSSFIVITNVGNRDISTGDFIEPLKISAPERHYILSCRYGAPNGVKLKEGNDTPTDINIEWNLLKPKQSIALRMIFTRDDNDYSASSEQKVKYTVLLKDVKARFGSYRVSPLIRLAQNFLFIAVILTMSGAIASQVKSEVPVFSSPDGAKFVLRGTVGEKVQWCEVLTSRTALENCVKLPPDSISEFQFQKVDSVRWNALLPLSMGYWLTLVLTPIVMLAIDYYQAIRNLFRHLGKRWAD